MWLNRHRWSLRVKPIDLNHALLKWGIIILEVPLITTWLSGVSFVPWMEPCSRFKTWLSMNSQRIGSGKLELKWFRTTFAISSRTLPRVASNISIFWFYHSLTNIWNRHKFQWCQFVPKIYYDHDDKTDVYGRGKGKTGNPWNNGSHQIMGAIEWWEPSNDESHQMVKAIKWWESSNDAINDGSHPLMLGMMQVIKWWERSNDKSHHMMRAMNHPNDGSHRMMGTIEWCHLMMGEW